MIETIPLQTAGAQIPNSLTSPTTIGIAIVALLAGMVVPLRYGMERLAGFARWFLGKLPYQPPPGKSAEQALQDAVEEGEDSPGDSNEETSAATVTTGDSSTSSTSGGSGKTA